MTKLIPSVEAELQAVTGGQEWHCEIKGTSLTVYKGAGKTLVTVASLDNILAAHSGGSNGYLAQLVALCRTLAAGVRADEHCGSDDLMPQPPCSWEHAERNAMCPTCHRCWQCRHADNCERGIAKSAAEEAGL